MELEQLKQITTLECSYSSSQTVEFHPLLRASRDHSTLQPLQLFRSLVRPVISLKERKADAQSFPFTVHRSQ